MVIYRVILAFILCGYGFAQSYTALNSDSFQAEATVEIQYDGEVGSGIILMTSSPSCVTVVDSYISASSTANSSTTNSSTGSTTSSIGTTTSSMGTTPSSISTALKVSGLNSSGIWTFTSFNTPPVFGATRTQMINATSTDQYLLPTATASSQMITTTSITQNLSGSSIPTLSASLIAGLGIRPDITWSHVFFWAAVTEMVLGIV